MLHSEYVQTSQVDVRLKTFLFYQNVLNKAFKVVIGSKKYNLSLLILFI